MTEVYKRFRRKSLRGNPNLKDLEADGRILLKLILKK